MMPASGLVDQGGCVGATLVVARQPGRHKAGPYGR